MRAIVGTLVGIVLCSCLVPESMSDAEAVALALSELGFAEIAGANAAVDDIRFNLVLAASGGYGTTITWASSDTGVIALDGTVSRSTSAEVDVTLTSTVAKNAASDSKQFLLTVIRRVDASWGNVQYPASTTTGVNVATENIYGQVYAPGCTDLDPGGQGPGILAQLGFGPTGSDPAAGGWTWVNAAYNGSFVAPGNNDEYMAVLLIPTAGSYGYAYRFSGDDENTWLYCDTDGTANGYSSAHEGTLTVVTP